jgi:hypothetical protein
VGESPRERGPHEGDGAELKAFGGCCWAQADDEPEGGGLCVTDSSNSKNKTAIQHNKST